MKVRKGMKEDNTRVLFESQRNNKIKNKKVTNISVNFKRKYVISCTIIGHHSGNFGNLHISLSFANYNLRIYIWVDSRRIHQFLYLNTEKYRNKECNNLQTES